MKFKIYFLLLILTINQISTAMYDPYERVLGKQANQTAECSICWNDVDIQDFAKLPCNHSFCVGCLNGFLDTACRDKSTLKCPQSGCARSLSVQDIKTLKTCNQEKINKLVGILTGAHYVDHKEDWGSWFSNKFSEARIAFSTTACPQCQTPIEKNGGCNHMTCTNRECKHEFCWICLGPRTSHYNHVCWGPLRRYGPVKCGLAAGAGAATIYVFKKAKAVKTSQQKENESQEVKPTFGQKLKAGTATILESAKQAKEKVFRTIKNNPAITQALVTGGIFAILRSSPVKNNLRTTERLQNVAYNVLGDRIYWDIAAPFISNYDKFPINIINRAVCDGYIVDAALSIGAGFLLRPLYMPKSILLKLKSDKIFRALFYTINPYISKVILQDYLKDIADLEAQKVTSKAIYKALGVSSLNTLSAIIKMYLVFDVSADLVESAKDGNITKQMFSEYETEINTVISELEKHAKDETVFKDLKNYINKNINLIKQHAI